MVKVQAFVHFLVTMETLRSELTITLAYSTLATICKKNRRKNIVLRNKFCFSEVHGSRNATCHVQSKWCLKDVMLTLHGTRCIHTSMNSEKWNLSLILTLCFYIVFVPYLWNFDLNLANKRRRKIIIWQVWLLHSTAITMTSIKHYVGQSTIAFIYDVSYVERRPKIGSSKEIVGECKYLKMASVNAFWRLYVFYGIPL